MHQYLKHRIRNLPKNMSFIKRFFYGEAVSGQRRYRLPKMHAATTWKTFAIKMHPHFRCSFCGVSVGPRLQWHRNTCGVPIFFEVSKSGCGWYLRMSAGIIGQQ
jgi:hypothetical protein